MHVESGVKETSSGQELPPVTVVKPVRHTIELTQEELDAIYVRTPDPVKRKVNRRPVTVSADRTAVSGEKRTRQECPGGREEIWKSISL